MLAYTLMLAATSTGAYASVFVVLFGWGRWLAILVGGVVVLAYSVIGGMWSITLAGMVQFLIMTVGLFLLMLPISLSRAGGWAGMGAPGRRVLRHRRHRAGRPAACGPVTGSSPERVRPVLGRGPVRP